MDHYDKHCSEGSSKQRSCEHTPGLLSTDNVQHAHQHDERYGEDAKCNDHHIERTRLFFEFFAYNLVHANMATDVFIESNNEMRLRPSGGAAGRR